MAKFVFSVNKLETSYPTASVKKITFKLKDGDLLGIIGPSGSGKSMLLETIVGLKKQDLGELTVTNDEKEIVQLKSIIGYSPQKNALYRLLTVRENFLFFGRLYGLKKKTIVERMNTLLKQVGLQGADKKRIYQLSVGMQKRADIAITLLHKPKIIVLDEPFSGLDISLCRFLWTILKKLAKKGHIVILTSHRIEDVQKYCNQIGLVYDSKYHPTKQVHEAMKKNGRRSLTHYIEQLFGTKI